MDIGAFLKLKRQEKELTQKEVADAVGVSEGTVSRWESGKIGNMRRDRIDALANVLAIDPLIITKYKYASVLGEDETKKIIQEYRSTAYSLDAIKANIAADHAIASGAIAATGAGKAASCEASAGVAAAGTALAGTAAAGAVAVSASIASPVAAALAGLSAAARALSTLVTTSPDADVIQAPTEFTKEERQMIEDYRTLSDSDKQTIQLMLRSLKEKHTVTTNIDGNSEEG
jgi:transcriptional regulator with XRE-family HTH domain